MATATNRLTNGVQAQAKAAAAERVFLSDEQKLRDALTRLIAAVDALHANDNMVRELVRSGLNVELCMSIGYAQGTLDATAP